MPAPLPDSKRKRPANLSLSPERLAFGHAYATAHATSLSSMVEDFLFVLEHGTSLEGTDPTADPLDGLLADWPSFDKKDLRKAQHEARLRR